MTLRLKTMEISINFIGACDGIATRVSFYREALNEGPTRNAKILQ